MTNINRINRIIFLWIAGLGIVLSSATSTLAGGEQVWTDFIKSGDIEQALKEFGQAVEDNPEDHLAHAGMAMLIPSRPDEDRDALSHWLEALYVGRSQPEAALYLLQAMNKLSTREEFQTALDGVNRVLAEDNLTGHLQSMLLYSQSLLLNRLGRWDEAAQNNAALGLITRYWYCGPFDNAEEGGHNKKFGPEENLDLNASYEGRRKTVSWIPMPIDPVYGYVDLHTLIDPSVESTTYLTTVLQSSAAQNCKIHIGHAGAIKVWLNGEQLADVDRYHDIVPDQVNLSGSLNAGANTLLLKVSSGEKGKYGVYVRVEGDGKNSIAVPNPQTIQDKPNLTSHTPGEIPEAPKAVNYEPLSLQLLKAIGESAGGYPHRPLFYALLLQLWHVADENDTSANTLLSQLTGLFPDNPLLWRMRGESEKQANRQRLGYSLALQKDPADRASFMNLLEYYRKSPFATKGFDLIREWQAERELPSSALFEQARMLNGKGLKEAAIDLLKDIPESSMGSKERMFVFSMKASRMTDARQRKELESILKDYPFETSASRRLFSILLRLDDPQAAKDLIEHERRVNPFSTSGWLELAQYNQAKNDFDSSLNALNEILKICPDHFESHRLSAVAYHQIEDDINAIGELQAALTARPSDPWCLEYMEFLQPDEETYASPYLTDWTAIQEPDDLDLSKANFLVLLNQRIVKVHPNGNSSETVREVVKILTETGIRYQQVRGIYYEEGDEVRVLRARVWKPDGSFFDAPAPRHRSASNASDAAQRLYEDYKVAVLQFQGLEKGAVLELEYEKNNKEENIYADYFGDLNYIGSHYFEPTVRSDYVLITPKTREFFYKYTPPNYPASVTAPNLESMAQPKVNESGSDRVWHWTFEKLPTIPREPLMPSATEIIPYLKVSTFQTWQDMTDWLWNLFKDQLIPGQTLHGRIASVLAEYRMKHGISAVAELSDWDKVRAVNAFVNTGVRYLGLEFGIHGYKPHKVDEICNAQYGDCKDKAALAVAMLKELGIEANMVILRTSNIGEIDYELPSLGIFNHAIYYLPDVDGKEYWIDGTATFFDASELPSSDAGANSLIVKPGGEYEFKRIPYTLPQENGALFTTSITLDAEGSAKGYRAAEFRGLYNPIIRSTYENPVKAKEIIDRSLTGAFPGSHSSDIELSDLTDYSTSERLVYRMEIPQFGVKQGNRWVIPVTLLKEMMSQRYATLSQREYDLILNYPWTRTNILTVGLPETPGNLEIPKDQTFENEYGRFHRTIELNGDKIEIKEEITFKPVRVPKEDYAEFREFCRVIDHYQDEKITFSE